MPGSVCTAKNVKRHFPQNRGVSVCLSLSLSSSRGLSEVPLIPGQRIQPLKVEGYCRDDLSYNYTHSLHTHTHAQICMEGWGCNVKMSKVKWQTAMSNKITVLIIHRFPTSTNSFPSASVCSNGWHQTFVKVKVERPMPRNTTNQFFHSSALLVFCY